MKGVALGIRPDAADVPQFPVVAKDPGAFAHNGKYILQILYDALKDLGLSVSGMTRP